LTGGLSYSIIESGYTPGQILCFGFGTLIRTIDGEMPVESLKLADQILTLDDGYQPLRWIGSKSLDTNHLKQNPKLRLIRIQAGSLGEGFPKKDLIVSPQHRILVRSKIAERVFGATEVLIPAKKLLPLTGIEIQQENPAGVRYFRLMFSRHQIIFSNGSPTETLYFGPMVLKALPLESCLEIRALFPEICGPQYHQKPARPIMESGILARKLVERHQKNSKPMFALV
jgi:hypothetical protein